ncbi:hypothetical protein [Streptacidiphilus sp. PAMC 29251]
MVPASGGPVLRTQAVNGLWYQAQPVTGITAAGVTASGGAARPEAVQTAAGVQYVFAASGAEAAGSAEGSRWTPGTLHGATGDPAAYTDATGVGLFLRTPAGGLRFAHTR